MIGSVAARRGVFAFVKIALEIRHPSRSVEIVGHHPLAAER
jgi:hypothetical protein